MLDNIQSIGLSDSGSLLEIGFGGFTEKASCVLGSAVADTYTSKRPWSRGLARGRLHAWSQEVNSRVKFEYRAIG